ncbi:MAG: universal stress protein, partial [Pseudomonadota bacterium]
MDLIEEEKSVTVLHVGDENGVRQPGNDILEHLSRHAMHPRLMVQARDGMAISDIVLNSCLEADTDLLVMGAYEHSRFSEMLLGGVTRDVVRQSHIPVLLSH